MSLPTNTIINGGGKFGSEMYEGMITDYINKGVDNFDIGGLGRRKLQVCEVLDEFLGCYYDMETDRDSVLEMRLFANELKI